MANESFIPAVDFQNTISGFVEAFNVNDLDTTMTYFADEAVYLPGDGKQYRGRSEIRAAFKPQFSLAWGRMTFDEHDRIIDISARKAVIRWVCRHDLSEATFYSWSHWLQRLAIGISVGKRAGWEGVDVFHFDGAGKIVGKFTYANYNRPLLKKDLGLSTVIRKQPVLVHAASGT